MATLAGSVTVGVVAAVPMSDKGRFVWFAASEAGYGVLPRYMKRARDSGAPFGSAIYVTWEVTDLAVTYPGVLPFGGPLVDTIYWKISG